MRSWVKPVVAALFCGVLWVLFQDELAADRKGVAAAAMAGYALVLLRYRKACVTKMSSEKVKESDYLVAYATETGLARQLAKQTCKRLQQKRLRVAVVELNHLANAQVPERALLIIASTTGNGDAPRTGDKWQENRGFLQHFCACPYAVLALGDRSYPRFCGFGLEVAAELGQAGAVPLFEPVLVHQGDPASVRYWFSQLFQSVVPARH